MLAKYGPAPITKALQRLHHLEGIDIAISPSSTAATQRSCNNQHLQQLLSLVAQHGPAKLPAIFAFGETMQTARTSSRALQLPAVWKQSFKQGLAELGPKLTSLRVSDATLFKVHKHGHPSVQCSVRCQCGRHVTSGVIEPLVMHDDVLLLPAGYTGLLLDLPSMGSFARRADSPTPEHAKCVLHQCLHSWPAKLICPRFTMCPVRRFLTFGALFDELFDLVPEHLVFSNQYLPEMH